MSQHYIPVGLLLDLTLPAPLQPLSRGLPGSGDTQVTVARLVELGWTLEQAKAMVPEAAPDFVDTVPNGLTEAELDASIAARHAARDAAAPREVTLSLEPYYPPISPERPLGWRDAVVLIVIGVAMACSYVMSRGGKCAGF